MARLGGPSNWRSSNGVVAVGDGLGDAIISPQAASRISAICSTVVDDEGVGVIALSLFTILLVARSTLDGDMNAGPGFLSLTAEASEER